MPPRHGKKLAEASLIEAIDEANKLNQQRSKELDFDSSDSGELTPPPPSQEPLPPNDPPPPEIKQLQGYTVVMTTSVYPPQPCERCVRANKTCKGLAGSRCEHCKSLHQKCSNSTGPPRGRHATNMASRLRENGATPPLMGRSKRKTVQERNKLGDDEDAEGEEYEDEDEIERIQPPRKKHRPSRDRARLQKDLGDLEASLKKMQAVVNRDITKIQQVVASLSSQLRELND